ncbi:hypothetical protein ACHWQZ_G018349 [Mnemiopsis leidyi]
MSSGEGGEQGEGGAEVEEKDKEDDAEEERKGKELRFGRRRRDKCDVLQQDGEKGKERGGWEIKKLVSGGKEEDVCSRTIKWWLQEHERKDEWEVKRGFAEEGT